MSQVCLIENAMAGERPICPILQKHYSFPPEKKIWMLETPEAKQLFEGLPSNVGFLLRQGFLYGIHGINVPGWNLVVDYFQTNSQIIPALTANPGTFTMLEKMYHFEPVEGIIDKYFLRCRSGGQALRNRYNAITEIACQHVMAIIAEIGNCLMIDIGSGPGRNVIDIIRRHPELNGSFHADCIDIDPVAISKGQELIALHGIRQVEFISKSMTRLQGRYKGNVDYGILIGILCGLVHKERVDLLRSLKSYFKPGAKLVAASLLEKMADEDLLCAYILRETTGWGLQYPPLGNLKEVFEEAGWKYEGFIQDDPTCFYEIGIGAS